MNVRKGEKKGTLNYVFIVQLFSNGPHLRKISSKKIRYLIAQWILRNKIEWNQDKPLQAILMKNDITALD